MNNFWKGVVVLCAAFAAAHCLNCRQCPVGIFGTCILSSEVSCNNTTQACYTGDAQFSATGRVSLHTRGCLDLGICNTTLNGTFLGASYSSTLKCCTTNLCNGATSVQLPLTVALCAAALSSLWGFWE